MVDDPQWAFIFDFDGTVSPSDMGHVIFNAFADPSWREIDEEWIRGEIPTSVRARRQFELVSAGRGELLELIARQSIDPGFAPLVAELRAHGIEPQVVSDGFDIYVGPMLAKAGLADVAFESNRLTFRDGSIELEFPHERPDLDPRGGWKAEVVRAARLGGRRIAYAGDGMSDLAAARLADLLFARDRLAAQCEVEGIAYHPFSNMRDIHRWVLAEL
ncbi:MAG: MtnX-like HAD-IB family phosphatase [Chloroflexi bacterium]|nr:MtnX-like HAD-IB family phosphatase [Chloroflexota bacterium]MCY3937307.1 MtnX-like HAD-IB family phosphatase [Chloroflexota bacterium]